MEDIMDLRIGTLARENFAYVELFIKYHIDFYCHGKLTLEEALAESPVSRDVVKAELEKVQGASVRDYQVHITKWPLDLLADYIQKTHHRYTEKAMSGLKAMTDDYVAGGSDHAGVIRQFQEPLALLTRELAVHMKKEELMLFPFIRKMAASGGHADAVRPVDGQIAMLTHEHETQHQLLAGIRRIFDFYHMPAGTDADFNRIMQVMKELDNDLALHLHLENNLLFPDTLRMQQVEPGS